MITMVYVLKTGKRRTIMVRDMVQLYVSDRRDSLIVTQYGEIPYGEWLERERERITRDPDRRAEVRTELDGRVGLWVDNA